MIVRFFALVPLLCGLAAAADYKVAGEALLDQIIASFRNPSANGLYAEKLDAEGKIDPGNSGVSYVWPASHVLRALRWGAAVDSARYYARYREFVFAVYRYKGKSGGRDGYAVLPGSSELFFDDNAVMTVEMALAYGDFREKPVLDDAAMAYGFSHAIHDTAWGIPQTPSQLGQGMFYSMAISPTAHGAAVLARLTGSTPYRDAARAYYARLQEPARLLKDSATGLFNQFTFVDGNRWSFAKTLDGKPLDGRGIRGYQTAYVIRLAVELWRATGEARYLADAKAMMEACLARSYAQGQGLKENAFWGGDDMIDALEDLHQATGEERWHAIARDILDYLVAQGRDARGWYPGDEDDARGAWNVDRRQAPAAPVSVMGQAAAAASLLRVAWSGEHPVALSRQIRARPQSLAAKARFAGAGVLFAVPGGSGKACDGRDRGAVLP